jgi:hypothetical protein
MTVVQSPVGEGGGLAPVRTRARGQILPPPVKVRLIRSSSVAGSGIRCFFTPGSGMGKKSGSWILDPESTHPGSYFQKLGSNFWGKNT